MDQSTNSFLRTGFLAASTAEVEDLREMNLRSLSTSQIKLAQIPDPRTLQRCLIQMRLVKFKEGEGSSCKSPFPEEIQGVVKTKRSAQTFLEVGSIWHIHTADKKHIRGQLNVTN